MGGRDFARSIAGVLGLVVAIVLTFLAVTVVTSDETIKEEELPSTLGPSPESSSTPSSATPCERKRSIGTFDTGRFDSDARRDSVILYFDPARSTRLLVCLGNGGLLSRGAPGTAEFLRVLDIQGDDRDEILFGGSTAMMRVGFLAIVQGRTLRSVRFLHGRQVVLREGLDFLRNDQVAGRAFGCRDVNGDGLRELQTARVSKLRGRYAYSRRTYELRGALAKAVGTEGGMTRRLKEPQPMDHADAASELIRPCVS